MSDTVLNRSLERGVLTLVMNRPDSRNALNKAMTYELLVALQSAATDPDVRAVLLTGAASTFCSGGDVKDMANTLGRVETPDERTRSLRSRMDAARLLHEMPKPTVAVIQGAAAGAGLSLALACDFRLATPEAKLTTAFAKVGLSGDFGGSYFLPRVVGPAKARELYLLSPVLTGEEALRWGLVNRVIASEKLSEEAAAFVQALADGPTVTYGYIKDNLNLSTHADLSTVMDAEAMRHIRCSATEDHAEAVQAFVAKRAPDFKGR